MNICRKKSRIIKLPAVILAAFIFVLQTACAGKTNTVSNGVIRPVSDSDRLLVYTAHKEALAAPIIKEFEQRTGIWVDVVYGGTTELLAQIEQAQGEYVCDIMFGGGIESLNACCDYFEPYQCKNAFEIKEQNICDGNFWTAFTELPIVIVYNSKLVSTRQAPKGFADLFEAKWQGKIAFADPLKSGSSVTILSALLKTIPGSNEHVIRAFHDAINGAPVNSSGDVVTGVSDGIYTVGITLEENAKRAIKEGQDIAIVYPEEGTLAVPDGVAIVKGVKHLDNAQKFIDFISDMDVQKEIEGEFFRRSVRMDVDDVNKDIADISLLPFDIDEATATRAYILQTWEALQAGGGKDE